MKVVILAGGLGTRLSEETGDGRFEAIVVDDGPTDGTGDDARAHGAATDRSRVFRFEFVAGTPAHNLGREPALP